ncbi:MAG: 4-hydroxy-3-methylbut-2-enyl diphosphate reductase [Synergistaceae bacterium]|nr:4-hydroxy-3-methylbut-2-enyl diphosphate reductase [Synergistaceae bacterium]
MIEKVIMAEHAGFCFGVRRAVNAISDSLSNNHDNREVWTIGLPIHNPQEVARLEALGLKVAKDADEVPSGAKVLIRAHGESLSVMENLKSRNIEVIDMTCPFVKKAQDMAANLSLENYYVILLGDKNHPEIKGILGHVADNKNAEVVANESEAEKVTNHPKIALISQTTQREERLAKVAGILTRKSSELHVCNTICKATHERQQAAKELVRSNNVDGVILIGGKESANTGKLRDIIESEGVSVLWIEEPEELEANSQWLNDKNMVGIAAGASTPEWLIDKVINNIAAKKVVKGV